MTIKPINSSDRNSFDAAVSHPLQSYEWGEFREKTGVKVIRRGMFKDNKLASGFQLTIHPIPHTPFTIGYLPKGELPTRELLEELKKIGKEEKCVFIQLEPNVSVHRHSGEEHSDDSRISKLESDSGQARMTELGLVSAARPLFTKFNFVLDITPSEEELLKNMHQKARYNIKIAQKNGVEVLEDNSEEAFKEYLRLTHETTERQKFYAHTEDYHRKMWETLRQAQGRLIEKSLDKNKLTAHLLTAKYNGKILTAWILFVFKDSLYYPYGASSSENREVMSSNLEMWEAIRFGKKLGLKSFDMWGALGPNPDRKDPWFGFHSFKEKYGPEHVEYVGSYDLVISPVLYELYKIADKLRWLFLRIKK